MGCPSFSSLMVFLGMDFINAIFGSVISGFIIAMNFEFYIVDYKCFAGCTKDLFLFGGARFHVSQKLVHILPGCLNLPGLLLFWDVRSFPLFFGVTTFSNLVADMVEKYCCWGQPHFAYR